MKIRHFETYPVRLPLKRRITWASSAQESMEQVYLQVVTDEGITGVAEGLAHTPWNGETTRTLITALHDVLAPRLIGLDPLAREKIWAVLDRAPGHQTAKAMVEAAIIEIAAKVAEQPCWQWLGGEMGEVPLTWIVTRQEPAAMVRDAVSAVERHGFRALKIKVGRQPAQDLEIVRQIRAALGPEVTLFVDANSGYATADALAVSRKMAESQIAYFEDPCRIESVSQFLALNAAMAVPVLLDRPCGDVRSCLAYVTNGAHAVGLKLGRLGYRHVGFVATLGKLVGTSVSIGYHGEAHAGCLIAAHFAAGCLGPAQLPPETSFFLEVETDLTDPPLVLEDGKIRLSNRPGYGFTLKTDLLRKYAID